MCLITYKPLFGTDSVESLQQTFALLTLQKLRDSVLKSFVTDVVVCV